MFLNLRLVAVCIGALLGAGGSVEAQDADRNLCHMIRENPPTTQPRILFVGDIHGANDGMRDVLFEAKVTTDADPSSPCEWADQPEEGTFLVQIGDMVDRGPGSLEAWQCLDALQDTAPGKSQVIRILGNHDMWWLQGHFHSRNQQTDTEENVMAVVQGMHDAINEGRMVGAFIFEVKGIPVIVTHAGIRPQMFQFIGRELKRRGDAITPANIVRYINEQTAKENNCGSTFCPFDHEIFDAGPDRGGRAIGGPLWTDFGVLKSAAEQNELPRGIMQVVGHSIAHCYDRRGGTPSYHSSECSQGLMRSTAGLHAVCVDGGMYLGARAFMEITHHGELLSHERAVRDHPDPDVQVGQWVVHDIASTVC